MGTPATLLRIHNVLDVEPRKPFHRFLPQLGIPHNSPETSLRMIRYDFFDFNSNYVSGSFGLDNIYISAFHFRREHAQRVHWFSRFLFSRRRLVASTADRLISFFRPSLLQFCSADLKLCLFDVPIVGNSLKNPNHEYQKSASFASSLVS